MSDATHTYCANALVEQILFETEYTMVKEEITSLQWVVGKLRSLRIERELRLNDMAERLGVVHSRVSDTESGRYDLKLTTLLKMLEALGTTPNDFFKDMPRLKEVGEGSREKGRGRTPASLEHLKQQARERLKKSRK